MSTVFLAFDTVLERQVAVKLLAEHLAEDEAFVARFRREALAAARLQHPNIVQVFDSGEDEPSHRHYIVMEYVEGPSCADQLREHKLFEVEYAVEVVRDACHGLDYAHRAGVIHRDVKPGNLLVSAETGAVKLADFGIAKAAEQTRITQVGSVLGTAAYLSPEQARGDEAGPASDVYSLGVCAYQFLAGRLPHEYSSLTELALKQQSDTIDAIEAYRPEVSPELDQAVRLALETDPAARYGSALEMAEGVTAGLHGRETAATRRLATMATTAMPPDETDATRALPGTAATRAIPRRERERAATPPPRARARGREPEPSKKSRRGRLAWLAIGLALLLAGAAVALAVTTAENGSAERIEKVNVDDQVQSLQDFIRRNTK
jgi:eukaryotic-like serine/threonine-protein kinase